MAQNPALSKQPAIFPLDTAFHPRCIHSFTTNPLCFPP